MNKRFTFSKQQTRIILLGLLMAVVVASMVLIYIQSRSAEQVAQQDSQTTATAVKAAVEPKLTSEELIGGLSHPWEVAFLLDKTLLFTERSGSLSALKDGKKKVVMQMPDIFTVTESGLTGLAVDADFANNRYVYTCFNAQTRSGLDVRLVRWRLNDDLSGLTDRRDIITNIPANSNGYHSGCRIKSASDGTLWVGTGDAYRGGVAQDPTSLGGKILHVTRDGMPTGNNLPTPFDPRIFSYGHRNVQGILLYEKPTTDEVYGVSIEHGTSVDDEINLLKKGNFGWAPTRTYIQTGVPMTDLSKYPDAISAIWSSGDPTIAPSGGTFLTGDQWGTYNGAVAMAVLKGKEVRILKFNSENQLEFQKTVISNVGRVRTAVQGPDGNLYISTDNGSNDKIFKLTPEL